MPSVFSDNMSSGHGGRFFGMYVMDVNLGEVKYPVVASSAFNLQ